MELVTKVEAEGYCNTMDVTGPSKPSVQGSEQGRCWLHFAIDCQDSRCC